MKPAALLLPLLLLLTPAVGSAEPPALALRADHWCPHTCSDSAGSPPGYLVELVRAALPRHASDYRLQSWARLRSERSAPPQPVLVVLGLGRSPQTERDYLMTRAPLWRSPSCFYTLQALAPWRYAGPASLRSLRLGVTLGYQFGDAELQAFLDSQADAPTINRVGGAMAAERHADMLLAGRSEVVLEDREALRWALRERGLLGSVREAGCLKEDEGLYVGVPRADPRAAATIQALEAGLLRLRSSGEAARVLARYGL